MKFILIAFCFAGGAFTLLNSCAKAKVQPITPAEFADTVSFSQKILPMMQTNCATAYCHDVGTASGGRDLSNYTKISENAEAALGAMTGNGFQQMPLNADPLPDSLILQFQAWISQGKLNN